MSDLTEEVLRLITDIGGLSAVEVARHSGRTVMVIHGVLRRLRAAEEIRIARYERQPDGKRGSCIPIYEAGSKRDAARIGQVDRNEVNRKYRQRNKALISARRYKDYHTAAGVWKGLL